MTAQVIWGLFVAALAMSFLLSGMEAGVFALSRLRIRQQLRGGRPAARVLYNFLEHPENFLWTILVGNTLANFFILGWLVAVLHARLWDQRLFFVAVYVLLVLLFYAFFDLLPKMLFRTYPNRLCVLMARPFRLLHVALQPLVVLVEWFSAALLHWRGGRVFTGRLFGNREELRLLMQESAQALTTEERSMINRVLDLQSTTVRQIMRPLRDVVMIEVKRPLSEAIEISRERRLTRMPAYEERNGQQRIVGLLSLNSFLYEPDLSPQTAVGRFIKPAVYLDEDLRIEIALRRMQRSGQRLAIVVGRNRRETGILTLQDVLTTIFGQVSL